MYFDLSCLMIHIDIQDRERDCSLQMKLDYTV